jgi:hypothetical protein
MGWMIADRSPRRPSRQEVDFIASAVRRGETASVVEPEKRTYWRAEQARSGLGGDESSGFA